MSDDIFGVSRDDIPLTFGRYKGKTPNEIAEFCPAYIAWAYENVKRKVCTEKLYQACDRDADDFDFYLDYFDSQW